MTQKQKSTCKKYTTNNKTSSECKEECLNDPTGENVSVTKRYFNQLVMDENNDINESPSFYSEGIKEKRSPSNDKQNEYINNLLNSTNFVKDDVVVWSSVRPEHQHLTVGWSGKEDGNEFSYLAINTHLYNDTTSYDGITLYDPNENVKYKGNTLYFGGCDNNLKSEDGKLEGLMSENKRFKLILKEDGNLIFKDNHVTIWESKTADLWQGKAPYKLIMGKDGVMRILNKFDYLIMSTVNNPEIGNNHKFKNYRLEVLNAGTFRIINENGEEVWNMWNHAEYHKFNVYYEEEFYDACDYEIRNPNLPLLTTATTENDSIIRVGEQLINRFTETEFKNLKRNKDYYEENNSNTDNYDFEANRDYVIDENNNFYSTARLVLSGFHLKYQNLRKKIEVVVTDRNPTILYGKLNNNGSFDIYDCKDHVLFTTGIEDEECTDNKKCFYFMYITPDNEGTVKIMKRHYNETNNYLDSLVWMFPPKKSLIEMRSDKENEFLENLESLIYREEDIIRDNEKCSIYTKEDIIKANQDINNQKDKNNQNAENNQNANDNNQNANDNNQNFENNQNAENNQTDENNEVISLDKCKIINEYPCITLRKNGVYFYGSPTPFLEYKINSKSKLQLDKDKGYLTLDKIDVLGLKDKKILTPTRIHCEIIDGVYGVRLLDRKNFTVWEYPDKMKYSLSNKKLNNTMEVGRSIYCKDIKCLDFQSNAFVNYNGEKIVEFPQGVVGRTLYMDTTQIAIVDNNEKETPVIKIYNPEEHDVKLYCKSKDEIVIIDEITKSTLWSHPTQKYLSLSSDSSQNQLRPNQELIIKEDTGDRFCLKIKDDRKIYSFDYDKYIFPKNDENENENENKNENENSIEYLNVSDEGVFVYYGDGSSVNLVNNSNRKGVYSVKCEVHYGLLKAVVYYNNEFLMYIPDYENKYVIDSENSLYYGEKEACLIFDNDKLYVNYNNYIIVDKEKTNDKSVDIDEKSYINIKDSILFLNDNYYIYDVNNLSSDKKLEGKCMDYHGNNKFVLYSPDYEKVLYEYPPIANKTVLKGDDIIYDKIYIDNGEFNKPCVRIETIEKANGEDKVGLFFDTELTPIEGTIQMDSILNNNSLRFDQKEGTLLLNENSVFKETFTSQNLELKCKYENDKLYAIIEDENKKEYWRYPKIEKKNFISSVTMEKLYVGEKLYDVNMDKYFNLTDCGISVNGKHIYKVAEEDDNDHFQSIYIEKRKDDNVFQVQFIKDHGKGEPIRVSNVANAEFAELRYEEKLGFYIIDSFGNILMKSKLNVYDDKNKFTFDMEFLVGDSIKSSKGITCAYLRDDYKFFVGEKEISGNVYKIELKNSLSPLTVNGLEIFKNFRKKINNNNGNLPKSMSLRCEQVNQYTFFAIYNDDTNTVIDEVMNKCRRDDRLISNDDYNQELCLMNSLVSSTGSSCLSYMYNQKYDGSRNFGLLDAKNNTIFTSDLLNQYQPLSFYLDKNTGNFMTTYGDEDFVLLKINQPKVKMTCNNKFEIEMKANDTELIWKYRPNVNVCKNGVELKYSNSQNIDCSVINKLETMEKFNISKSTFGKYYKDDILQLSILSNGNVIANNNETNVILKDEWNLNRNFNYAINCKNEKDNKKYSMPDEENGENLDCKYVNLSTKEVITQFNSDNIRSTFYSNTKNEEDKIFNIGQKIMCKNGKYGFILTQEGFKYRETDENNIKQEILFEGQDDNYEIEDRNIINAHFDENNNFVINYSFGHPFVLVKYENKFNNDNPSNKDIRITCDDDTGKIQFFEVYNNEKKVYYDYPKPKYITTTITEYHTSTRTEKVTKTTSSYTIYTNVSYQGTIGDKYYLGVNELKEYTELKARYGGNDKRSPSKYIKWLIKSENSPSYMYLANNNGGISDYCLNVGQPKDKNRSYYLSISKCSNTNYMFKYNLSYTNNENKKIFYPPSIAVYKDSKTLLTNDKGTPYCLYYSDTLRIEECKNPSGYENFNWKKFTYSNRYTKTSTKTEVQTTTKYITSSSTIVKTIPAPTKSRRGMPTSTIN
ncbi:hypothetical protein PIROE2DRAFT_56972 [Piromyces sp. E2]|nr:hypothetical protein PIROE2DRAFT_56972 [Piromyces sp. E2]|eukprot:OUM70080.1 hypothetical protein PIROE2DRAFT_56972 [Piromyces sp. E2]